MSNDDYGRMLAADAPALTDEQVTDAARIYALSLDMTAAEPAA